MNAKKRMPPPPCMHKSNATIILEIAVNSKNNLKFKKALHLFVELFETNPLIYNTLYFD